MRRQTETARVLADRPPRASGGARRPLPGFGAMLSFDVAGADAARRVETATRLIVNATSLGGTTSSIESAHRWEGDRIPPGLLRLWVGLEDADELWADLEQALANA